MYNRKRLLLLIIPISLILQGCDSGPNQAEKAFAESILKDMVPIEGGTYEMEDFGKKTHGGFLLGDKDTHHLRQVTLDDFKLSVHHTT